jgi:hypothetical protein
MAKYHLMHDYTQSMDGTLGDTALHVAAQMDGNVNFTNPPVTPADLKTAANNFIAAVAVCDDGTTQDTLHKKTLRTALIAMLDRLAGYVELTANNDPEIMKSSGFNLASTTAAKPAPVGTVAITSVTNPASGSLNLGLDMGTNVWGIEVQVSTAPNVWTPAGYYTDPRNVTMTNLTPGTMYSIRARVHGSFNQVSDWSDTVNHMAM